MSERDSHCMLVDNGHVNSELDVISRTIRISIGKFNEFVDCASPFIVANRRLIEAGASRDPEVIATLFRNMHTLKGNARTFEFTQVTDAAHRAEQAYDRLRKNAAAEWSRAELLADLDSVQAAVTMYTNVNED